MRHMRRFLLWSLLLWPLLLLANGGAARTAVILEVKGAIGPASGDYLLRGMERAAAGGAELVIIRMDTPGGLDTAMRDIIQGIIASAVPVVTYVSPSGARAASAGTYILYASHVAAMAPATNLGAATPVQIGGVPDPGKSRPLPSPDKSGDDQASQDKTAPPEDAMERKMVNDAVAYIRSLARLRGRNEEWAEKAVREAASLQAEEALKAGVIDIVATDVSDLLKQLDGRTVKVLGEDRVLDTKGLVLKVVEPDWRSRLLAVITDPNVAYILMLIGIYGLFFEFANPGFIFPGVIGAICLLLALFAFQVLPVNYAGLGLILLGISFMVAEVFVPSFGALGIGGVVSFVIGSIILFDTNGAGYAVSLPLVGALSIASGAFFIAVLRMAIKVRRSPVVSGQEELVSGIAVVLEDFQGEGHVRIHSEIWNARSPAALKKGQQVRVTGMDGLVLKVEPN